MWRKKRRRTILGRVKVGIDCTILRGLWGGVRHATARLVNALAGLEDLEMVLYLNRWVDLSRLGRATERSRAVRPLLPTRLRTFRMIWQQFLLPGRAFKDKLDVLHCPAYVAPRMCLKPTVVTVHDVSPLLAPELFRRSTVSHLKRFLPVSVERAQAVITPTHAAKKALHRAVKVKPQKIHVVPFGVGEEFTPPPEEELDRARRELELPERFVLYVGNIEPRKNIEFMIKGFFAAVVTKKLPHSFLIAGQFLRGRRRLQRIVRELKMTRRVRFLGYVGGEFLPALYSLAEAFVFMTTGEGFGFPPLEAMACGTPAIISRDPALKEIAGDAALRSSATDLREYRLALDRILTDTEFASRLAEKGLKRAKRFNWRTTAEKTLEVYRKAIDAWEEAR